MRIEEYAKYVDWMDFDQIVEFNKLNHLELSNYSLLIDNEKISDFIDYKLHYCNVLFEKLEFEKVLFVLNEVSELLSKLDSGHWNYKESKAHEMFLLGMIFFHKKELKKSYNIFSELVKINPEKYRIWFRYVRFEIFKWFLNIILISGICLVLFDLFFSGNEVLIFGLDKIGFFILCAGLILKRGVNEYFEVIKPPHLAK